MRRSGRYGTSAQKGSTMGTTINQECACGGPADYLWLNGKPVCNICADVLARDGRRFQDIDGNACTLDTMCRREPLWAANRIRTLEADMKKLRELCARRPNCVVVDDEPGIDNQDGYVWMRKIEIAGEGRTT